jgi:hypothetical protein
MAGGAQNKQPNGHVYTILDHKSFLLPKVKENMWQLWHALHYIQ